MRVPGQALLERALELPDDESAVPSAEALAWFRDALADIAVAGVLSQLGGEWTVLHSIPVGVADGEIDHIVIGPTGVFTISTMNDTHRDAVTAGSRRPEEGKRMDHAGLAAANASIAGSLLSATAGLTVPVTPLVVLAVAGERTIRAELAPGVRMVSERELLHEIRSRRVFSDGQVQRIVAAAVEPSTWGRVA
jgi:Nuclease-related domain